MNFSSTLLSDFFTQAGHSPEIWIFQLFAIVLTTLIVNAVAKILLTRYCKQHVQQTKSSWDNAILSAIEKPLGWLIWVYGISFAGDLMYAVSRSPVFELSPTIRSLAFIIWSAWFLTRFIREAERNLAEIHLYKEPIDPVTLAAMGKLLRIAVTITTVLIV